MRIGELAKRSGMTAHTIRYYERIGLLPAVDRDAPDTATTMRRSWPGSASSTVSRPPACRSARGCVTRPCGRPDRPRTRNGARCSNGTGRRFVRTSPPCRTPTILDTKIAGCAGATQERDKDDEDPNPASEDRYARGARALAEIDGEAGERVIAALADIAPDFARYLIEFPFGDIYARPGLDLRSREIATIAALTAMGNAAPQLKVHVEAGLNVGLSRAEITEVIMQMAVYAGFPAALNGLFAAKEVFASREA